MTAAAVVLERSTLTLMQGRFLAELLEHGDGLRAAIAAGYSPKTAAFKGSQLKRHPTIVAALEREHSARLAQAGVTPARIIAELATIAFADTSEFFDERGCLLPIAQIPEHARRAIAAIETTNIPGTETRDPETVTKIKGHDKVRALELLGKYRSMFTDRVRIEGSIAVVRIIDQTGRELLQAPA